jgi:drug/metabolite transporter (DMT)-like permease
MGVGGTRVEDERMAAPSVPSARSLSFIDLAALLYLGAVWGAVFLFMRIAAPQVGPVWAADIRLLIGAAVLLAMAGRRTLPVVRRRLTGFLIVGALFSALPFTFIAIATVTLPAGFAALLNAATPLFTAAIGMAFLGNRPTLRVVAGLVVGVVAVVALVGWSPLEPSLTTLLAVAAGLGAPLSYAVAGNFVRARMTGIEPTALAVGMVTAGALLALPVAIVSGPPGMPNVEGVLSLIGVGTLSTAFAWPVFFRVLRRTTATAASTVTFIVPAFALAFAAVVLGEAVGVELVVGFGLILASLCLVLGIVPPIGRPVVARVIGSFGRA